MVKIGDANQIRTEIDTKFSIYSPIQPYRENRILITESRYFAAIYDSSVTFQPIQSWTFKQFEPLISPVIYDRSNKRFVGLKNKQIDLIEPGEDGEVSSIDLINECVAAISVPGNGESLILFANGHLSKLSDAIREARQPQKKFYKREKEKIVNIQTEVSADGELYTIALFLNDGDKMRLLISKYGFAYGSFIGDPISVDVQGCVCFSNFIGHEFIGVESTGQLWSFDDQGKKEKLLSLSCLSVLSSHRLQSNFLALVAETSDQQYSLIVINLEYQIEFSRQPLEAKPLPVSLIQSSDNLLIGSSKGVIVLPYEVKTASLASVLGRAKPKEQSLSTPETSVKKNAIEKHIQDDGDEIEKMDIDVKKGPKIQSEADAEFICQFSSTVDQQGDFGPLIEILSEKKTFISENCIYSALRHLLGENWTIENDENLRLLRSLLCHPYNHDEMVRVLRDKRLSIDELCDLLETVVDCCNGDVDIFYPWVSSLIEAYFKLIVLSKNSRFQLILDKLFGEMDSIQQQLQKLIECKSFIDHTISLLRNANVQELSENRKPYRFVAIDL